MLRRFLFTSTLFLLSISNAIADSADTWNTISNIFGYGMPLVALGYSIDQEDEAGALQLGGSLVTSLGTSLVLKNAFPKDRPDGSGNDSFPSDHAAIAFSSARYMTKRYDANPYYWYAAAGITGLARVQANKHTWGDVIAGCVIGFLSSEIWTSRQDRQIAVFPQPGGLAVSFRQQF
jgi:membrane-associated phospholipid phosphatase